MSQQDSKTISLLRFPLTFAVVMLHCMGQTDINICWTNITGTDIYNLTKILFSGVLCQIAVPTFFFISGYLFFAGATQMDKNTYKKKIARRIHSLFIPYILWNLITIPLILLTMYGETLNGTTTPEDYYHFIHNSRWLHLFTDFHLGSTGYKTLLGYALPKAAPILSTLWFVKELMIVSVLSPLIYIYIKKTKIWGGVILLIIYLLRIWPPTSIISPTSLFFVFGAYLSINNHSIAINHPCLRKAILTIALLLLCMTTYWAGNGTYQGWLLMPLFTFTGLISVVYFAHRGAERFPSFEFPAAITKSSFFVYAIHIEFALPLGFFITKKIFANTESPTLLIIQYFLTTAFVYGICLLTYSIGKHIFPKTTAILNGNRL